MIIWQTKAWGDMLVQSGQAEQIFEIPFNLPFSKGVPEEGRGGIIFVEKRKVSFGEYGLFVIGLDKAITSETSDKLIELCKKEKALFIQVETLDYNTSSQPSPSEEKEIAQNNTPLLQRRGAGGEVFKKWKAGFYKKFITPYTAIIDLTKSEEEILLDMKPKGRYNIRLAEKKGVEVKQVEKSDDNIKKFYDLMIETTSRDGFSGNNINYYSTFLSSIENSKLLFAYKDEKVIAGGIFVFDKEVSIYYYGVSTGDKDYRNLMAPYLLQWEAIKYAKSIGSKLYDFLGVSTPGDTKSSLAGVTDFKMKLTKDLRCVSDSYIWVNKKLKYYFINTLRKFKK
ncbi:MAG: peptidoglycan bridge formation glycyltransferase FemA/FemB family protein [Candidatus Gracilibacteria bacterium]|nr:peptidoglycan bridge formation glycyltransferase FemA/FemB family protein [Candidatus Gracilibacteria bacterium]